MNNAQIFSQYSDQYARHRPQYPDELFSYLSEIAPGRDSAWDCATGNGQAAVSLAKYFSHVDATDISTEQIENHIPHPKIHYGISPAEHTSFADSSFDLITVATAVHWFDPASFHKEVDRVLKPGGILAVWTYSYFSIQPEIDEIILTELLNPVDRFWVEGNRMVLNGYRELTMPYEEIRTPAFSIHLEWTLGQLTAYMRTWSAVKRYLGELGTDPVESLEAKLGAFWKPEAIKTVHMPLHIRACRKPA